MTWVGKIISIKDYPYKFVGIAEYKNGFVDFCPQARGVWLPIEIPIHESDLQMLTQIGKIQIEGEAPQELIDLLSDPDYDVEIENLEEAEELRREFFRLSLLFQHVLTDFVQGGN